MRSTTILTLAAAALMLVMACTAAHAGRLPSALEKQALKGTGSRPGRNNPYVLQDDLADLAPGGGTPYASTPENVTTSSGSAGASADYARGDHRHSLPAGILSADATGRALVAAGFFDAATASAKIAAGALADGLLATSYIKADGTRAFTGAQSMGGFKLTNLGAPTAASSDAATALYSEQIHGTLTTTITAVGSSSLVLRSDVKLVDVYIVSCGGAGGSGRRGATTTTRVGGGGGAPGLVLRGRFSPAVLGGPGATVSYTIPAAPTGGAAKSSDADGSAGAAGASLVFGPWTIPPGASGAGGTAVSPAAGGTARSSVLDLLLTATETAGGSGTDVAGTTATGTFLPLNPTGGGGGGGLDSGDTIRAGGVGGAHSAATGSILGLTSAQAGGAAGPAGGATPGVAGGAQLFEDYAGTGGGGGGSATSGQAGAGGKGGFPGGGGGGGGAAQGVNSGAGGDGGDALVVLRQLY